ncbi:hypothetical protein [Actinomadura sp. KC216]|uniref:hypothetical protein n=1 Tax=Actinomadura sp. KC216 TaxID=2530370 RepID=UPI001FB70294|nr:hypothetical protein [Actinomadura sp. KC216]
MRSGSLFERPTSAPRTSATACSSSPALPTPRARDSKGRSYEDGLPAVVELLPTPTVSETNGTGPPDSSRNDTLRAQVALLPTPRASENENRQTKRTPSQEAGTHGLNLAAEVCSLLPTPRATDGTKGGPNQRGSSGDLMLPSAVMLLPTPRVAAERTSRRTVIRSSSSPSLAQVVEIAQGETPRELAGMTNPPTAWRGDRTPPPSTDGPGSSDGQLLLPGFPPDATAPTS